MYKNYAEDNQLNFQINRFLESYYSDQKLQRKIYQVGLVINNLEEWYFQWRSLADEEMEKNNFELASSYYQLADFFLTESDHRKKETYELFKDTFYKSIADIELEKNTIRYKNGQLPVAIIRNNEKNDKWIVFHGGFDSYLEELIRLSIDYLSDLKDFNILMFEGPGQGKPAKEGLYMQYNWEEPVAAVLDYFHLENIYLLGMSLGGYLALRAAAKEKRIKKVMAFDILYSMEDSFQMNIPKNFKDSWSDALIDKAISEKAEIDIDLRFKFNKAKDIFGKERPSEVLNELKKYTLYGIENEIEQETLLLAGTNDLYVPTKQTSLLISKLVNAAKIESHLFGEATGGQYHCQVGNKKLAFNAIKCFLSEN